MISYKTIFISWTSYARHSELLSNSLDAKIFYVNGFIKSRGVIWKVFFLFDYLIKGLKSFWIINSEEPDIVFVQNPPAFAPVAIAIFNTINKFKFVIDSHNGAFEPPWVNLPLHKWSLKKADLVIVHNYQLYSNLKNDISFQKVDFTILHSKLTDFSGLIKKHLNEKYILVVTTFSGDEPVYEMMEGIKLFIDLNEEEIKFKITGNHQKQPELFKKYSQTDNIEFLGFVNDDEYKNLLLNAYGVVSLSTRDDVQQFALMEAIGAEVPFISSQNSTNKSLFHDKMILTQNSELAISEAIKLLVKNRGLYYKNIQEIKKNQMEQWNAQFNKVKKSLADLT